MPNTIIQLKKSPTTSAVPSSLEFGELALNYADGKIYYKNSNSFIVEFAPGGGSNFGTVNANGTFVVSDTSGDVLTLVAGPGISIVGDAINDLITFSSTGGSSVAVSDVAPPTPTANSLWWNSLLGKLFIYYNDGSSSQWVETTSRSIDQLSSNITVNTITTYNETSSLVIRTGNANNGIIKVEGANNEIFISKIPIVITNNATRLDIAGEFGDYTTSFNSYAQLHMRNASSGPNASGDLVITNDTGTDTGNFIDLGINGSGYADPAYNVVTGGDGYLYTSNGNLAIGTANTSVKEIRFHTGGSQVQNERIVIAQGVTIGYSGLGDPGANNMNVVGDVRARSFSGFGTGFANMNVVNTLGYQIWNVPTGVKRWKVTVCGGGGSGGGTHGIAGAIGCGAGSGGVSVIYFNYVDGVNTMAMNVGLAGGFGVVTTNANGVTGFPSNVNYNNTWAFGNGGIGGANSWFGGNVSAIGVGGAASGGVLNLKGANGQIGGIAAATNPLVGTGGATPLGLCTGGEMAIGTTAAGANGTNAASFGGGGGGGKNASSTTLRRGGSGANGVIIIEW